jgi:phenylalanyl-tRNA synthetase beta subunit
MMPAVTLSAHAFASRTLSSDEVNSIHNKVAQQLKENFSVELR